VVVQAALVAADLLLLAAMQVFDFARGLLALLLLPALSAAFDFVSRALGFG